MTDFMLTVGGTNLGARDVQVNNAGGIREAIEVAEKVTGAPVLHGRGGIGSLFNPAIIIDAESGSVDNRHDHAATESLVPIAAPRGVRVTYPATRPASTRRD